MWDVWDSSSFSFSFYCLPNYSPVRTRKPIEPIPTEFVSRVKRQPGLKVFTSSVVVMSSIAETRRCNSLSSLIPLFEEQINLLSRYLNNVSEATYVSPSSLGPKAKTSTFIRAVPGLVDALNFEFGMRINEAHHAVLNNLKLIKQSMEDALRGELRSPSHELIKTSVVERFELGTRIVDTVTDKNLRWNDKFFALDVARDCDFVFREEITKHERDLYSA